jgi:hypothetical protein
MVLHLLYSMVIMFLLSFMHSSLRRILLQFGVGEMSRFRFCDDGVGHTIALGPSDTCPDCKQETAERTMFVMNPKVSRFSCCV